MSGHRECECSDGYPVKVLVQPCDAGESLGDDWLLATIGYTDDARGGAGGDVYLTTNRVRASEYGFIEAIEPLVMARACEAAINAVARGVTVEQIAALERR